METKLSLIFDFLKENRQYNKNVQEKFYASSILPYTTTQDKVISLLYDIANTQNQPKIDHLSPFFKKIIQNKEKLNSFQQFISLLHNQEETIPSYNSLYLGLKKNKGWGDKTAALFTKSIFHIHNKEYDSKLKFWNDAPTKILNGDEFYLPVDAVIIKIFSHLNSDKQDFKKINEYLKNYYSNSEIEVWDDLWFWGFITQKGLSRELEWNEDKYWALKESDKNPDTISQIKQKAEKFLQIIQKQSNTCS